LPIRLKRIYLGVMTQDGCSRCGAQRLRAWRELDEAEREVVRRLPASAVYSLEERATRHRWCVRCWHEETAETRRDV
jgi:alpha-ketoglutarate-dependent taurine dioxygenase